MKLNIQPLNRTIDVEAGTNLLQAFRNENIPVSFSCTTGKCGVCRCKVVSGHVLEGGREGSLPSAKNDASVLACQSTVTDDCIIEIPEPDEPVTHPAKILKAKVSEVKLLTHDILQLRLKSPKKMEFSAGQYVSLQFTPEHIRPYSMASISEDDYMDFHIRLVANGRVTSYLKQELKVGDSVRVTGPMGTSYLRSLHQGPILCIAGGTGLAPILSIVKAAVSKGMRNPIHVYFGALTPNDVYGEEIFQDLCASFPNIHFETVVMSNTEQKKYRSGLVTDAVFEDINDFNGWRSYLAGSPQMVEAANMMLKRAGHDSERIYADAFYSSGI
jgi:naphthalene 1,2-dioxygenase ferredoxin reductase component